MTGIARFATFFVAPAAGRPVAREVTRHGVDRTVVESVGVLCDAADARFAGAAVGLWLARARGSRAALVCCWTGADPSRVPAAGGGSPAARRLAERLAGRELEAGAAGRLALVMLPPDPDAAIREVTRARAASGDLPAVLVLGGARPPAFDGPLAAQERLVVVPPMHALDGIEIVAVADAARLGRAIGVLRLPPSSHLRAITSRGIVLPPAVRLAVDRAMRGDDV